MDAVVPETGVTLDTRLLGQNIIILSLEVADNLREASFVVNLVAESGGIDNGQGDTSALLIKLQLNSDGLDLDTLLNGRVGRIIGILVLQNTLAAESVDECSST
jgi:hypothetical protein